MFILKFIFAIFLIGLFAVLFTGLRIYLHIRKVKKDIFSKMPMDDAPQGRSTTIPTGETITDTRTPASQRKIIPDDEGEYVDFEEIDN